MYGNAMFSEHLDFQSVFFWSAIENENQPCEQYFLVGRLVDPSSSTLERHHYWHRRCFMDLSTALVTV